MAYDDHQWALLPLLKASMLVYILLFATMFMRFRYRMVVYIGMILYFHQDATENTGKYSAPGIKDDSQAFSAMIYSNKK